ncbi:PREDICTED: replication factor A protein 1-like [Ipomoea nil]|uniref:replication factor A protein 1-like n=1 Tax=Ipomoea nil TaxID=35883 RepID=UPI000901C27E|nr:PREDICTED: replication factor A protein 1-like [Ipomoea nil]
MISCCGNQIRCTLWDDHVGKIEPFFNASSHEPMVVILQFCRIRRDATNGEVRLCSSYDVTQVLINQQSKEFLEFRESLILRGVQTPMRSIESFPMMEQTQCNAQDMKTISEIYQTREYGDYWVAARIVAIEDSVNWYYSSCRASGCNKKLESKGGLYYCTKCEKSCREGNLRYRLKIRVADLEGNAPFLLWDRECNQLLGISVAELKSRHSNATQLIPSELQSLVKQCMLFRVVVRKEQFENLDNVFSVMRINTDQRLIQVHAPELLRIPDKYLSSKVDQMVEDDDFEEEFVEVDEGENLLGVGVACNQDDVGDSSVVKRRLLDKSSSTQTSKNKGIKEESD